MIETRYYCRIYHDFFDVDNEARQKKIEDKIFAIEREFDLQDFGIFNGCGACYPYTDFWSEDRETAEKAEKKILGILKLHKIKIDP